MICIQVLISFNNMNNIKKAKFISGDKDIYENFTVGRLIAKGGNSFVYEISDDFGNIQCIKEIRFQDKMSEFIFRKEVQLLIKLKANPHPNIVQYKGNYILQEQRSNYQNQRKGYIQMEKGLTNLKQFLQFKKEKKEFFHEDDVLCFISSMIDAFAHIQSLQLAHRDAKPSNILIFCQDPLYFKVCDVGAGTAVGLCDQTKQGTVIGTPFYLSPELLRAHYKHQHLTNYNPFKSDIYSLGLVFLEFCCLRRPQRAFEHQQMEIGNMIKEIKERYNNIVGLGKILRKMLEENEKNRFDFIELDNFINENDLLRNKINSNITLDPKLMDKLSSSKQVFIQTFEQLPNLSKIISSGNTAQTVKIQLNSADGFLQNNQKQLLQQIKNVKYINLQELYLKMELCDLSEKQAEIIAKGIGKNSKLKVVSLNLWNNKIKNEGFMSIMSAIQSIVENLEELSILVPSNGLKLNNEFQQFFCLSKAQKLKKLTLNLSFNEIQPQSVQTIFNSISLAPNLESLSIGLESMKLSHVHFKKGIKEFEKLNKLKKVILNASHNPIREEGIFGISDFLISTQYLEEIQLLFRHSQISDKGFVEFVKSLKINSLKKIKVNFIGNSITQKGLQKGSMYLQNLPNISMINLNLSNNKINDLGIKPLAKSLIQLKEIHSLRLIFDGCNITEKGCLYLGRLISQQPLLSELQISLRYNIIELKGIQCLCTGLLQAKKLKKLKLVLEGTLVGDIAANELGKCLLKIRTLTNVQLNMENCDLGIEAMENILKLVKLCSRTAEQISVSMRKNQGIRKELYEKIKKQLNNSRIAIKVDQPENQIELH